MNLPRRDAARNRARIEEAARELVADGRLPGLNAVARAADVGVATVYRHFASVGELEEALVWNRFTALDDVFGEPGPDQLERVLSAYLAMLIEDALFERVTSRGDALSDRTRTLRDSLVVRLDECMRAARERGELRADIEAQHVLMLMCGLAFAARNARDADPRQAGSVLLRVVLDGLAPSSP
ncbi:transcriptional regulator, TetR family [Microbacterium sp. cf332]|nr:TetR family transcriptional regulator [Microbacterium sp. cf332]SDQ54315.1 transcriptional regulator, TetR family [Microbacterium sp. cf332]